MTDDDDAIGVSLSALRVNVERELLRHSLIAGESLVPSTMYRSAVHRMIAESMDGHWSSAVAAQSMGIDLLGEWLRITNDLPQYDLDWTMRAFALTESKRHEPSRKLASLVKASTKRRRRAA